MMRAATLVRVSFAIADPPISADLASRPHSNHTTRGVNLWNMIGFLAAALVLSAFFMREMIPLRILALCSNVAFLTYGMHYGLMPVWLLHLTLLPMNACRLAQAMRLHSLILDLSSRT